MLSPDGAHEQLGTGERTDVGTFPLLIADIFGASLPFGGAGWWPLSLLLDSADEKYPSLRQFKPTLATKTVASDGVAIYSLLGTIRTDVLEIDIRKGDFAIIRITRRTGSTVGSGTANCVPIFDVQYPVLLDAIVAP